VSESSKTQSSKERRQRNARRRQGRILALQTLYESDMTEHSVAAVLARLRAQDATPPDTLAYASELVTGVRANEVRIDAEIERAAPAFPVEQLPAIDRNILRIAIYELLHALDVPPKAAINEAVEIAKEYGGEGSIRFVNGVLGTVLAQLQPPRERPDAAPAEERA
jgi:N utilization substance protein B